MAGCNRVRIVPNDGTPQEIVGFSTRMGGRAVEGTGLEMRIEVSTRYRAIPSVPEIRRFERDAVLLVPLRPYSAVQLMGKLMGNRPRRSFEN